MQYCTVRVVAPTPTFTAAPQPKGGERVRSLPWSRAATGGRQAPDGGQGGAVGPGGRADKRRRAALPGAGEQGGASKPGGREDQGNGAEPPRS